MERDGGKKPNTKLSEQISLFQIANTAKYRTMKKNLGPKDVLLGKMTKEEDVVAGASTKKWPCKFPPFD